MKTLQLISRFVLTVLLFALVSVSVMALTPQPDEEDPIVPTESTESGQSTMVDPTSAPDMPIIVIVTEEETTN